MHQIARGQYRIEALVLAALVDMLEYSLQRGLCIPATVYRVRIGQQMTISNLYQPNRFFRAAVCTGCFW